MTSECPLDDEIAPAGNHWIAGKQRDEQRLKSGPLKGPDKGGCLLMLGCRSINGEKVNKNECLRE